MTGRTKPKTLRRNLVFKSNSNHVQITLLTTVGADQCQSSPQTKETMNHKDVKYGILLTREQLDFLKDDHQGFHRMKALDTFLSLAAIEPFHYEKKNFSADLGIGQFAISKVELAELWHCDRKTVQKMIDLFNEVGILTSVANNRTTIHTIHCISSWLVDGQQAPIRNPHYMRTPPYRFRRQEMKASAPVMQPIVPDEANNTSLYIGRGAGGTGCGDNGKQNVVTSEPVKGEVPADQANATSTSFGDNGNSHPQSQTSNNPVLSLADANDDEREKNMLPPYEGDGQLPEDYLEPLDEHYSNLPPEADETHVTSNNTTLCDTSNILNSLQGIDEDEGSTNPLVSQTPNIVAADAFDNAESALYGSD